jgi:hypothetical protein
MANAKLAVTTPQGTFTRATHTAYTWVGIGERIDDPERGVRLVGARMGKRARYLDRWSTSPEGARRNVENYGYDRLTCVGVYPVDGTA